MKFLYTVVAAVAAAAFSSTALADHLPHLQGAPTTHDVKERIAPPEGASLYDVWYAKGNRIYQCNPERTGFQHWYNVQTHAFLYRTEGEEPPFDKEGKEIGQLAAMPLNSSQQMADPMETIPVIYYYPDGSWAGSTHPLATTTKEPGRVERGDAGNLDDHLEPVAYTSEDGYLSHAKYIVRLNSIDGAVPAANECTIKGMVVNKPFTAYFMVYTDHEGLQRLAKERVEWNRMVEKYKPSH